jgi:RsiW-degrading membrane proteinase PrsW (M82 family)
MAFKRPGGDYRRGGDGGPTQSEIFPLASKAGDLVRRAYFLPGVFVAICAIAMFYYLRRPMEGIATTFQAGKTAIPLIVPWYAVWLAALITGASMYFALRVVGKSKPWWVLVAAGAFTGLLLQTPAFSLLHGVTCNALVPAADPRTAGWLARFVNMFFCAGLPEEIFKGLAVAAAVFLGLRLAPPLGERLGVGEPVDAMLVGAASGLGFAFVETVFVYVPRIMVQDSIDILARELPNIARRFPDAVHRKLEVQRLIAQLSADRGSMLLVPRLVSDIFGHMAYSMYVGYFIGLAALRPRQAWKLVLIGVVSAAAVHALWNSAGGSIAIQFIAAVLALLMMGAAAIKARELSPNRAALEPSQILDRMAGFAPRLPVPGAAGAAGAGEAGAGAAGAAGSAGAAPVSETWGEETAGTLVIRVGAERVPAVEGARLLARQVPGLAASGGDGVVAEVRARPEDPSTLGLRNLSDRAWRVTTDRGEHRELVPGRTIRIARGTRIDFGTASGDVV